MTVLVSRKDQDRPTVSVVIPLYNKEAYIARALSSVLSQEYVPNEIIIVDDGSTDNSCDMVRSFNDPRIVLVHQENRGPGGARNRGLAQARGQYISFLDADDEWHPSFLKQSVSYLAAHPSCSLVATEYMQSPTGISNSIGLDHLNGEYEVSTGSSVLLIDEIEVFTHLCFTVIKTDIARKWGGYYDKYRCTRGEDQFFFVKLLFNERIGILRECLGVYHRESSDLYCCGLKTVPPIVPILSDPEEIIDACPPEKLSVLRAFLAERALRSAELYSKLGEGRTARQLIRRFCKESRKMRRKILRAKVLAWAAPALPSLRSAWRMGKRIGEPTI
jgi:hypothetical protein